MASPYRADHVGSLLRPPEVLKARSAFDKGEITYDQLNDVVEKAVLQAIQVQKDAGVDVFTDGEYRRSWWAGAMFDSLEGIQTEDSTGAPLPNMIGGNWQGPYAELARNTLAEIQGRSAVVVAKLRKVRSVVCDEAASLKAHAPGPWKVTMAAVANRAAGWYRPGITDKAYPTEKDLIDELIGFFNTEVNDVIAMGCSYVQLDSLRYTQWMNPVRRQAMLDAGLDLERELDDQIAWDNASIAGARGRPGLTVGHHICRGNNRSAWGGEGGYEAVAEKLFNTMDVDRFLLEYDTERAGGFEPLRFVPRDKMVVLGIISSKLPELEPVDDLVRRIEEASKYVDIDRLAISPQCGFASTAPGNMLTWDEQRHKLELIAQVARKVWG
ncbi:MAG TPA: cobalamin-independent methionine synthase II family protein [Dehalococcoidia bacterium]|nr:cobalamin-independent methionine synthase II family protein [Dehalococcoidia bacterium]